jgi:O-antigen/teichoic acid export membrane protein
MFNNLRLNPSDIFNNDFQGQELRHTVVKGSLALVFSQGISFGLSMISTLVLARLLTPTDFGLIGMVTVVINFIALFKDAGLSTATIQNSKIDSRQISTLFWINAGISLSLALIILLSSPLIAIFYKKPELTAVTAILSIEFLVQGTIIQHRALLQRHLKFTALAIIDIISQLSMIAVAIVMAALGFRYWALVGGTLASTFTLILLTVYSCPWSPSKMHKGTGVRNMLKFGGRLTLSNFVHYLSRNTDNLLIGRIIGAESLGLYSKSFSLLMTPLNQIRTPLTTLSLPVLSSLKNHTERYRSYFRQLLDISISLALPISIYCFLEGDFLIRILLGPKWMSAVPVFKILSVAGVFVALSAAPGLVMLSHGYAKRHLHLTIITATIVAVSFIIGVRFGINGVAFGYTIANFLIMIPLISFAFKGTPITIRLVLDAMIGPLFASIIAGILAYFFLVFSSNESITRHILAGLIFLAIYLALTWLRPQTRSTLKSIWESIVSKKKE